MSRFKNNGKKEVPEINTGSMSDIIFMFLFFFMVITTMRESDAKVKFSLPNATEYQKLDKKNFYCIYMGTPTENDAALFDNTVAIQLNGKTVKEATEDGLDRAIADFVKESKQMAKDKEQNEDMITYFLRIDGNTHMTAVNTLKYSMRKNEALKVQYATTKGNKKK